MRSYILCCCFASVILSCQHKTSTADDPVTVAQSSLWVSVAEDTSKTKAERKWTYLEREIDYLMNIWPGIYDNVEQLDYHKYAHPESEINPIRVHAKIEEVGLPAFGENVLYVEEYTNDNAHQLSHQAIYQLTPDEENKAILITVHEFKSANSNKVAVNEDLEELSPISPLLKDGWNILITREGFHFKGIKEVDTVGESLQILISENRYNILKDIYASGQIDHQLQKSRCFVCMIDFPREDGGRPVNTVHYIEIHDQGGKFEFDYRDGRHMVFGMRNTWSYGMQRETFVIFIQEEDQDGPTLIYSWGEPGADRIGFNPGWIRVQCDLDTPDNRQFQKDLRSDS